MTHERVVALNVTDEASYQSYRDGMLPILTRYGGAFRYDLDVNRVRKPVDGVKINRLFVIHFPDKKSQEAFFADPEYLAVRHKYFQPAVDQITPIADYDRASDSTTLDTTSRRSRLLAAFAYVLLLVVLGIGTLVLFAPLMIWTMSRGSGGVNPPLASGSALLALLFGYFVFKAVRQISRVLRGTVPPWTGYTIGAYLIAVFCLIQFAIAIPFFSKSYKPSLFYKTSSRYTQPIP